MAEWVLLAEEESFQPAFGAESVAFQQQWTREA